MCSTTAAGLHLHLTELPDGDGARLPALRVVPGSSLPHGRPLHPFSECAFPIVVYHPDKEALVTGSDGRWKRELIRRNDLRTQNVAILCLPAYFPSVFFQIRPSRRRCCDTFYTSLMLGFVVAQTPWPGIDQRWVFFKPLFCRRVRSRISYILSALETCHFCPVPANSNMAIAVCLVSLVITKLLIRGATTLRISCNLRLDSFR